MSGRAAVSVPMVRDPDHTVPIVRARLNEAIVPARARHRRQPHDDRRPPRRASQWKSCRPRPNHDCIRQSGTPSSRSSGNSQWAARLRGMPVLVHDFRSSVSRELGRTQRPGHSGAGCIFVHHIRLPARSVIFSFASSSRRRRARRAAPRGHRQKRRPSQRAVTFPSGRTRRAIVDTGYEACCS